MTVPSKSDGPARLDLDWYDTWKGNKWFLILPDSQLTFSSSKYGVWGFFFKIREGGKGCLTHIVLL